MSYNISWSQFLIIAWVMLISLSYVGKIDGYFYPVVTNFTVTNSTPSGIGTLFWGSFDKVRDCNFRENYAEYVVNDSYATVDIQFLEEAKIHGIGHHTYGPWYIAIPKSKFKELEFYAVHECLPFWKTVTPMKSTIIDEH